jgi:WD40 repeat protein
MVELESGDLITGAVNGSIRRWDREGKPISKPTPPNENAVWGLASLNNGEFYTAGGNGIIRRWRVGNPNSIGNSIPQKQQSSFRGMVKLRNGELITASLNGSILRWRDEKSPVMFTKTGQKGVRSILATKNGGLVTGGSDGTIRLWDASSNPKSDLLHTGQGAVLSIGELNDKIFTGGIDGTIKIYDFKINSTSQYSKIEEFGKVSSLVELRNGVLITGGEEGKLRWWLRGRELKAPCKEKNMELKSPCKEFSMNQDGVSSIVELSDNSIVAGSGKGTIFHFKQDGQLIRKVATEQKGIFSIVEIKDGRLIAGGRDGTIRLINLRKRYPLGHKVPTPHYQVQSMVRLRNDKLVTLGAVGDEKAFIWDISDRMPSKPLHDIPDKISSIVELTTGKLVTGGSDGVISGWRDKKKIDSTTTNGSPILSIGVLRNGEVITADSKGSIVRWRDGKEIGFPIELGTTAISRFVELRNGDLIIIGGEEIRILPNKQDIVKKACEQLNQASSTNQRWYKEGNPEAKKMASNYCKKHRRST